MLHRPFQITDAQARLLRSDRNKYELQIACVLMDDPVPARLHWPFLANLRVNGRPLPVMYRQSTSPMGKAGRDPPVAVPPESFSTGNNTLTIQAQDVRPFSVLVRVAKRRTLDEVKAAVPAPLSFPMARAHLERELGGAELGSSHRERDASRQLCRRLVISGGGRAGGLGRASDERDDVGGPLDASGYAWAVSGDFRGCFW